MFGYLKIKCKMASTNQSPQYQKAEAKFISAQTDKERLFYLEEMIRECPKHKSAEKMLAQLKTRRKKLLEKIEGSKKAKSSKERIKKEELQAIIVGLTNSGKSSLLSILTNASPEIAEYKFTTKQPEIGMSEYHGAKMQIIENPAIGSEYYDKGLTNSAEVVLILITNLNQIEEIEKNLEKATGKRIVVFNLMNNEDSRKISATLQSKKREFVIISAKTKENIEELKEKIFSAFGKIRIYTKEPGKEKSNKPLIFEPETSVKKIAEKILKNINSLKETKIWGPSSKFPGQVVGLNHKLKDKDIVEFRTK